MKLSEKLDKVPLRSLRAAIKRREKKAKAKVIATIYDDCECYDCKINKEGAYS